MNVFPNIKESSNKQYVIEVLSKKWPLTLNQISQYINNFQNTSYQAIRQAVLELVHEKKIKRIGKYYSLNIDWLKELNNFSKITYSAYKKGRPSQLLDKDTNLVVVNSLTEFGYFLLEGFEKNQFDKNIKKEFYGKLFHLWFPFLNKTSRERWKNWHLQNSSYLVTKSDSFVDKALIKLFYDKCSNIKIDKTINLDCDVLVVGDCVLHIYIDNKLKKNMAKNYNMNFKTAFEKAGKFMKMHEDEYKISVIITRDKLLAKQFKDEIRGYFK